MKDAMKQKETGGVQAASARTYDKPRAHDEQRGEQAGFHARVPPCNSVPFHVPMPHDALLPRRPPLQIPPPQLRGSCQCVGSLVSYKVLSTGNRRVPNVLSRLAVEVRVDGEDEIRR